MNKEFMQGLMLIALSMVIFLYSFGGHFFEFIPLRDYGNTRRTSAISYGVFVATAFTYGLYLVISNLIKLKDKDKDKKPMGSE